MIDICYVLHRRLEEFELDLSNEVKAIARTGVGRCRRVAASFSAGASNATTGTPNVAPTSEASEPPREWPDTAPVSTISPSYIGRHTREPDIGVWVHVCYIIIEILRYVSHIVR